MENTIYILLWDSCIKPNHLFFPLTSIPAVSAGVFPFKKKESILIDTFSWDAEAKAHMMAYDKQPKDLSAMYDEDVI